MEFKDKVVLITGAASGIGKTTAEHYAKLGAKVILSDYNEEKGLETTKSIKEQGGTAHFIKANVAVYAEVENLMKESVETYGQIDIAVNNAGIGGKYPGKTHQHTLEDWDRVVAVNQTGVFYCMKLELEQMMKQNEGNGSGCIVNISSMAGLKGLPNQLAYVASKHAVIGMTKTAALEYARKNIRVNVVCPVFTTTPLFQKMLDWKEGMDQLLLRSIPVNRFGTTDEIANAILWLSSDQSEFITGLSLPVDGGMSAA